MRVIESLQELDRVAEPWHALRRHPWSDPGYFAAVVARREGFVRPHVIALEESACGTGLVVANVEDLRAPGRPGPLRLGGRGRRILRVPTGGVLGLETHRLVETAARHLREALDGGVADALYLHEVAVDCPLLDELREGARLLQREPFPRVASGWSLAVPPSFEDFRAGLSPSTRKNLVTTLNRVRKRLGADLRVVTHREPADLERIVSDTEAVAREAYQRRLGVGFVDTDHSRRVLAHALESGWFRCDVLLEEGRPIAFQNGMLYGETYFGQQTGYVPGRANLRPGVFLFAHLLEDLCARGDVRRFDLGTMDGDFKRSFATHRYRRVSSWIFARSRRGRTLWLGRAAAGSAERAARSVLGSRRIRRLVRGRRRPGG